MTNNSHGILLTTIHLQIKSYVKAISFVALSIILYYISKHLLPYSIQQNRGNCKSSLLITHPRGVKLIHDNSKQLLSLRTSMLIFLSFFFQQSKIPFSQAFFFKLNISIYSKNSIFLLFKQYFIHINKKVYSILKSFNTKNGYPQYSSKDLRTLRYPCTSFVHN